jgi:hypothetical protein
MEAVDDEHAFGHLQLPGNWPSVAQFA